MIVLIDGVRYVMTVPENESTLEKIIEKNYQHIFGEDSYYFDLKRKITSAAGIGSVPDAYLIIFDAHACARWYVLEVELASHPLYEHVIPQLTKFNRGIESGQGKKKIIDMLYEAIKGDPVLEAGMKKKIGSGEIYKFLSELISSEPTIIIAIDEKTDELKEAIKDIRGKVDILELKSFRREDISEGVNAYLFNPMVDFKIKKVKTEGVTKPAQIIKSDTVLSKGMKLQNTYKGKEFVAEVIEGGRIKFNSGVYNSVSSAAVAAIRSTGSKRNTEDGWRWWRYQDPQTRELKSIDDLRKNK